MSIVDTHKDMLLPIFSPADLNEAGYAIFFGQALSEVVKKYNIDINQISSLQKQIEEKKIILEGIKKLIEASTKIIAKNDTGLFNYAGSEKAYTYDQDTLEYTFNLEKLKMISKYDDIDPFQGQLIICFNTKSPSKLDTYVLSGDCNYPNRKDLVESKDADGNAYYDFSEFEALEEKCWNPGYRIIVYSEGEKVTQF